ncbi:hypothetical protein K440DRAFT_3365 [Wilcoxina mikolae CBS 423.85]|nr:hypothetical protein K440DRAFT_3365 [Wilcoxina mikolae CBS 423.85]
MMVDDAVKLFKSYSNDYILRRWMHTYSKTDPNPIPFKIVTDSTMRCYKETLKQTLVSREDFRWQGWIVHIGPRCFHYGEEVNVSAVITIGVPATRTMRSVRDGGEYRCKSLHGGWD